MFEQKVSEGRARKEAVAKPRVGRSILVGDGVSLMAITCVPRGKAVSPAVIQLVLSPLGFGSGVAVTHSPENQVRNSRLIWFNSSPRDQFFH